uniref:SusC/RagA family TonB-linked outer membrane protein n=1 Tax=uncultured Draconibacterium sp. TaxID=1573823 RepID=UPI003217882E
MTLNSILKFRAKLFLLLLLVMGTALSVLAQERTISGEVTDEKGDPMPGVNVLIKGTTRGVSTGFDGTFELSVNESDILIFSFIGYEKKEVAVKGTKNFDIQLSTDAENIDEVVVTALGIKREKKALGYSVQEVKSEEMVEAKEINLLNSLSGKVAGLQISKVGSGAAGSSNVIIRGYTSIKGDNRPLFVIDGIPVENSAIGEASEWGGFDYGDGIADINQEDIETVSVLKGPSAAALYGTRAANGAILITTKKGTKRKGIGINFSSNFTVEEAIGLPEYQNTYGRGTAGSFLFNVSDFDHSIEYPVDENNDPYTSISSLESWGPKMAGQMVNTWTGDKVPFSPQPNNVRDFFRTGFTATNNISLTGTHKDATVRVGFGNMSNRGLLPNSAIDRFSTSISGNTTLGEKMRFEARLSYVHTAVENRPSLAQSQSNTMYQLVRMPRSIRLEDLKNYRDENLFANLYTGTKTHQQVHNPYWVVNLNENADVNEHVTGYFKYDYEITPWLNTMVRAGLDLRNVRTENKTATYNPTSTRIEEMADGSITINDTGDAYSLGYYKSFSFNSDFLVTAHKEIWDDWIARLNVGGSIYKYEFTSMGSYGEDLKVPDLFNLYSASQITVTQGHSEKEIQSLYYFGQLAYKDAIYVDIQMRHDWDSSLTPYNCRYDYPSVSTSFILTETPGLEFLKSDILSFAKVRGSFAQVGSGTSPYQTILTYSLQNGMGNSIDGNGVATLGNTRPAYNLKPQKTNSWEVGTDLRFVNNRLGLDLSYYKMNTRNQIIVIGSTRTNGFSAQMVNAGNIQNSGVECTFVATPVQVGDFKWDVRVNYSKNKSEVIELAEGLDNYWLGMENTITITAKVGEPFGNMYGKGYKRNENGDVLIDSNGFPMTEGKYLGNYQPDWVGGVQNIFRYKGIKMSFLLDARFGGDIYSKSNVYSHRTGNAKETLEGREDWYDTHQLVSYQDTENNQWSWKWAPIPGVEEKGYVAKGVDVTGAPNTKPVDPQEYWSHVASSAPIAEEFIYDGSYIKLREVTLGYELPRSLLKKSPFNRVFVSFVARNLAYIFKNTEDFDPESSYNTSILQGMESSAFPNSRSYGCNLVFNF